MGIFNQIAQNFNVQGAIQQLEKYVAGSTAVPNTDQFNIERFKSGIAAHDELAKIDHFDVNITLPLALTQLVPNFQASDVTLLCEQAQFPDRAITMAEYRHYGFNRRIPHFNSYSPITLQFIVTGDMWATNLFNQWMDLMVPTTTGIAYYSYNLFGESQFEANVAINQYDAWGNKTYQVNLVEALPASMQLNSAGDWNNQDFHRLSVTFLFQKWTYISTPVNAIPSQTPINSFLNALVTATNFRNGLPITIPGIPGNIQASRMSGIQGSIPLPSVQTLSNIF